MTEHRMTANTDLAAALLADVRRCHTPEGTYLHSADILAALSRALDPALAERVGEEVESLRLWNRDDAADLLAALLTANAALRAERDEYKRLAAAGELAAQECRIWQGQAEAAEAERDALRAERDALAERNKENSRLAEDNAQGLREAEAEVEKLRGALEGLEKASSEVSRRGAETGPQWSKLTIAILQARAALTETATTEERG